MSCADYKYKNLFFFFPVDISELLTYWDMNKYL